MYVIFRIFNIFANKMASKEEPRREAMMRLRRKLGKYDIVAATNSIEIREIITINVGIHGCLLVGGGGGGCYSYVMYTLRPHNLDINSYYVPETHIMDFIQRSWFLKSPEDDDGWDQVLGRNVYIMSQLMMAGIKYWDVMYTHQQASMYTYTIVGGGGGALPPNSPLPLNTCLHNIATRRPNHPSNMQQHTTTHKNT